MSSHMPDSTAPHPHPPGSPALPRPAPRARAAAAERPPRTPFSGTSSGSMRNGVIAIHRDGTLALMNDEAYRIFALTRRPGDIGRPFTEVLQERPARHPRARRRLRDDHLPNRAELRLKDLDRVIGYTLSQVKDDGGERARRGACSSRT